MTKTTNRKRFVVPRFLAIAALVCAALFPIVVIISWLGDPRQPLALVVGLALLGIGAWLTVSRRRTRRIVGVILAVLGIAFLVWTLLRDVPALLTMIALVIGAVALGLAALSRSADDDAPTQAWTPSRPVLICNPKSGGGKVVSFNIAEQARAQGIEVVTLQEGLDLEDLARDAIVRGADCLGMAGGDGSQALVAAVAVEHGIPFVVISAGTRNHFALDLGLDRDNPDSGLVSFTNGVLRTIDYATVNGKLFVNNVSFGLYASIVENDSYRDAKLQTTLDVLPEVLAADTDPYDMHFRLPSGEEVSGSIVLLVSNNPYITDGLLGLGQRPALDSGQLGGLVITGPAAATPTSPPHESSESRSRGGLQRFTATELQVTSSSPEIAVGIDGETVHVSTPVELVSHP
ncbi:MAG: diacylglycerol kinase, partial [Actinomycetales bacterium]|nr:diacylglycerol kinase [Actinomycetales bacterium]